MIIKKKTLYIVLPFLIVVVLLLLLFVFLMGWLGNTPKLNRYDSLIETCEVEKKLFKVLVRCDVFINETSQRDDMNCLDLTVVNKDSTNILSLEVCEKEKILDTSSTVLKTDMKVPMYMVFKYTYRPLISYGISDISMELIEDREVSDILYSLYQNEIGISEVRLQERVEIEEKGYYHSESNKGIEGLLLGTLTFTDMKINKISIINEEVVLDVFLSINNVMHEYQVRSPMIGLLEGTSLLEMKIIRVSNISEIEIEKSYGLKFLYIPNGETANLEDIEDYCRKIETDWFPLCYRKEQLSDLVLDMDIERYIEKSVDKLMIYYLIKN